MQLNFNRKEYERKFLQPGGYVGKIVAAGIEGETVKVFFDIAQGEFKDIYLKEYQQNGGGKTFDPTKWNKKAIVNFNFQYAGAKYAFADLLTNSVMKKRELIFHHSQQLKALLNISILLNQQNNLKNQQLQWEIQIYQLIQFLMIFNLINADSSRYKRKTKSN